MFSNAQEYNQEGSQVWQDAQIMHRIFDSVISQLAPHGIIPIMNIIESEKRKFGGEHMDDAKRLKPEENFGRDREDDNLFGAIDLL